MVSVFIIGITCLMTCFSGLSNGQCNMAEVLQCYTGGQLPNNMTDLQTACTSVSQVLSCLNPYLGSCTSDSNFQQMMANLTLISAVCAAGSNCSIQQCYTDAGIDMNSNGDMASNVSCEKFRSIQSCFESIRSACAGNFLYTMAQTFLQQAEALCGGSGGCDLLQCFSGAGSDISILNNDPRNMSCGNFVAVYPCLLNQKSACAGNMMYTLFESYFPDYEGRCGQQGPRDVGNSAIPDLWILLPVVLKLLAVIAS
ncbi:uncharacterized protein LOC133179453 [Saccostrea echinata]|uniref:uncharacterized protein LOC133179453 n=1 Tax=Saccostrea echinata TaxID=191078 RepID=UPI002A7EB418|nr:uncharacterized protein LOC133179453 [Saccostrea echinata]